MCQSPYGNTGFSSHFSAFKLWNILQPAFKNCCHVYYVWFSSFLPDALKVIETTSGLCICEGRSKFLAEFYSCSCACPSRLAFRTTAGQGRTLSAESRGCRRFILRVGRAPDAPACSGMPASGRARGGVSGQACPALALLGLPPGASPSEGRGFSPPFSGTPPSPHQNTFGFVAPAPQKATGKANKLGHVCPQFFKCFPLPSRQSSLKGL